MYVAVAVVVFPLRSVEVTVNVFWPSVDVSTFWPTGLVPTHDATPPSSEQLYAAGTGCPSVKTPWSIGEAIVTCGPCASPFCEMKRKPLSVV